MVQYLLGAPGTRLKHLNTEKVRLACHVTFKVAYDITAEHVYNKQNITVLGGDTNIVIVIVIVLCVNGP